MDANEALLEQVNEGLDQALHTLPALERITMKGSWCKKQNDGALTVVIRKMRTADQRKVKWSLEVQRKLQMLTTSLALPKIDARYNLKATKNPIF